MCLFPLSFSFFLVYLLILADKIAGKKTVKSPENITLQQNKKKKKRKVKIKMKGGKKKSRLRKKED